MSTSDQTTALSNINFTGGYPTSADLAPSIIFLIAYVVLTPVLIFRVIRRDDRCLMLIRPSIFLGCRLAMLVLRAVMAKTSYGEGLLIAELVLVSIGFLFLIEPVVTMWKRHVDSVTPKDLRPRWIRALAIILKIAVIGAIVTAVVGYSEISGALTNTATLNSVKSLRRVSAVLSAIAAVVVLLATVRTHFSFPVDRRGTIYLIALSSCLIVIAVYRVVQTFSTSAGDAVRSRAAFWVLQMLFELIAFVLLLAISMPSWFPGDQTTADNRSDVEKAQAHLAAPVASNVQYK